MFPLSGLFEISTFPGRKDEKEGLVLQDFHPHRDALDRQQRRVWGLAYSLGHTRPLSCALLVVAPTQTQSLPLNILALQVQVPEACCPWLPDLVLSHSFCQRLSLPQVHSHTDADTEQSVSYPGSQGPTLWSPIRASDPPAHCVPPWWSLGLLSPSASNLRPCRDFQGAECSPLHLL